MDGFSECFGVKRLEGLAEAANVTGEERGDAGIGLRGSVGTVEQRAEAVETGTFRRVVETGCSRGNERLRTFLAGATQDLQECFGVGSEDAELSLHTEGEGLKAGELEVSHASFLASRPVERVS